MLDVIKNRRTVRKFNSVPVENEKILEIIKSGMQAPSSKDSRPWEFVIINDRKVLDSLSKMHHAAKQLKSTQACIVLLADKTKFIKAGRWILDLSACMENMLLECVNQQLCAGWIGCFPKKIRMDYVSDLLNLPEHVSPYSIVALGYSDEEENTFINKFEKYKIHINKY